MAKLRRRSVGVLVVWGTLATSAGLFSACGSGSSGNGFMGQTDAATGGDATVDASGGNDGASFSDTGINFGDSQLSGDQGSTSPIPQTCTDSNSRHSYIGCDYWPTVTLNPVYEQFDFAVAVSNPQ